MKKRDGSVGDALFFDERGDGSVGDALFFDERGDGSAEKAILDRNRILNLVVRSFGVRSFDGADF